jgi:hypothetical protein
MHELYTAIDAAPDVVVALILLAGLLGLLIGTLVGFVAGLGRNGDGQRDVEQLEGELEDARTYAERLLSDPDFLLRERVHRRMAVGRWRVCR